MLKVIKKQVKVFGDLLANSDVEATVVGQVVGSEVEMLHSFSQSIEMRGDTKLQLCICMHEVGSK